MTTHPPTAAPPTRPAYRDGRVLRAADLRADGDAHADALLRHQAVAHLSGVVVGLTLKAGGGSVSVDPGMAVDGRGRWLLVPREHSEDLPDGVNPWEAWLAHYEPPARDDPSFEVIFSPPGEFDPADPATHPDAAVFLGTVVNGKESHFGRVGVGVTASRVEGASRTTRLLLAPQGANDPRRFAVGTSPSAGPAYTDRLALDATGTFRIDGPADVDYQNRLAAVVVGHTPPEFGPDDLLDADVLAAELASGSAVAEAVFASFPRLKPNEADPMPPELIRALLRGTTGNRRAGLVLRVLNRVIEGGESISTLVDKARAAGRLFRQQTVRRMLERAAGRPDADARVLTRLVLEDVFPGLLASLPPATHRGVVFAGAAADKPPSVERVYAYLADVTDKTGRYRELRVVFDDPGKENQPERSRVCIGSVGPDAKTPDKTAFDAGVTVSADRTVHFTNGLTVTGTNDKPGEGLIVVRAKAGGEADPNDPAALARRIGQVAPWDLRLRVRDAQAVSLAADNKAVLIGGTTGTLAKGELVNTGKAAIVGVQLHAVAFTTDKTAHDPVRRTLMRDVTIEAGKAVDIQDDNRAAFVLPLGEHGPKVTVVLLTVGAGPGGVVASDELRVNLG